MSQRPQLRLWEVQNEEPLFDPMSESQEILDKLVEACKVENQSGVKGGERYGSVVWRQACRICLEMWCKATMASKRQEFKN